MAIYLDSHFCLCLLGTSFEKKLNNSSSLVSPADSMMERESFMIIGNANTLWEAIDKLPYVFYRPMRYDIM
jgi:hypothetical protein